MIQRSILFVCTGNACRSQMAESICRHLAGDRFEVFSCGSNPAGFIHPLAAETMAAMGMTMEGQESKSWDCLLDQEFGVVVTVCDAADALCPEFPGSGIKVHWPMPDPSFMPGTDRERLEFCHRVAQRLELKISRMLALDFDNLGAEQLMTELEALEDL